MKQKPGSNKKLTCVGGFVLLVVTSCSAVLLLFVWSLMPRSNFSEPRRICDNLLAAGLLESRGDCLISGDKHAYYETMIPYGVSEEYVRTAMQGFEPMDEGTAGDESWVQYKLRLSFIDRKFLFNNIKFVFVSGVLEYRIITD